eukprot:symbB.v1.2.032322.t1/scaffold3845.1/size49333/2
MQRSRLVSRWLIAGVPALLFVGRAFAPVPTLTKGERTSSKETKSKVISDLAAWSEASPDSRRLRSGIESILRDQEALREDTPVATGGTLFSVLSAATLAVLGQTSWVAAAALPVIASAIFSYTSVAESSGTKSLGLGRCMVVMPSPLECIVWVEALAESAEQERKLAVAEAPKALLPFGAGCTAIFAAACVTVKLFEEDPTNAGFLAALGRLLCGASVLGAVATNDQALLVNSKLAPQLRNPLEDDDDSDDIREMEDREIEVKTQDRILLAIFGVVISLLPLAKFEFWTIEGLTEAADEIAVVVSASAAAVAALSFLIAEKNFADAERRVAAQSRQSALSELFFAQAQADSAILGANTAMSASSLGLASVAAEFSKTLSSFSVWPAVASTFWSTVSAVTSRSEADAAYLENESAKRAMQGLDANLDTVDAAASELRDLQRDFTQDDITENIRAELKALDRGESREFSGLARDQRRKVHLLAGELGMLSQSFGSTKGAKKARTVVVTNPPSQALVPVRSTVESDVQKIVDDLGEEAEAIQGTLQQSGWQVVSVAGVFILGSAASPLLLSTVGGAKLLLPLATGTVGLATAWQETAGKSAVAIAKRQTAFLLTKEARAETFLGRAHLAYAAFPTDVAIATLATIATGLSSVLNLTTLWKCLAMLMVIPAYTACSVAMQRRRKVERFVGASMRCVDAAPIPPPKRFWKQRWWMIPAVLAVTFPCDLYGRATIACAAFAGEIAIAMAESSMQLANATGSVARAGCVVATADAWCQLAQFSTRALPYRTALAVVSTLIATALVEYSLPLCALFPTLGAAVFARSFEVNRQSQKASAQLAEDVRDMQVLRKVEPWPLLREVSDFSEQPSQLPLPQASGRKGTGIGVLSPLNLINRARKGFGRLKTFWEDSSPAEAYRPPASDQSDLSEIRSLTRYTRRSWFRTFSLVGVLSLACVLQPWLVFSASEVVLPVAGALLTIFVAASESDARRAAAASKVRAADLKSVTSTMEEFLASGMQFRSFLLAFAGVTAASCVLSLVPIKPWYLKARTEWVEVTQNFWSLGLVIFHCAAAAASALPFQAVRMWTSEVKAEMPSSRNDVALPPLRPGIVSKGLLPKGSLWRDLWSKSRWSLALPVLAALPGVLLGFFPSSRPFEHRAVASTAGSSFVVAGMLFLAERALFRAELLIASRRIAFALTDTLANEAEQQSALLPAATIALSGAVTFGVELNPFFASALALVQARNCSAARGGWSVPFLREAVTWVLASRKALQARYGSNAAIQVATVTESRMVRPGRPLKEIRLPEFGACVRFCGSEPGNFFSYLGAKDSRPAPMQRRKCLPRCVIAGFAALCFGHTFIALPSLNKGEHGGRTSKQAETKVISEVAAWSETSSDSRRLRSGIESILRDQEALNQCCVLLVLGFLDHNFGEFEFAASVAGPTRGNSGCHGRHPFFSCLSSHTRTRWSYFLGGCSRTTCHCKCHFFIHLSG